MSYKFQAPVITFNRAPFEAVKNQVAPAIEFSKKIPVLTLETIMVRTANAPLTDEDRQKATQAAAKMAECGWMEDKHIAWCEKHHIPVPTR